MSRVLTDLLALLSLERLDKGLFRGQSQDLGFGQVFGGQVVGQALSAAQETVADDRFIHSFHSYFLLPGDVSKPIIYDVETIRDGGSFSSRRVKAVQEGRILFYMTASFQIAEKGFCHAAPMPDVPKPESLKSEQDYAWDFRDALPDGIREKWLCDMPLETRPVHFYNPLQPQACEPIRDVWFKANGSMPDDSRMHNYLLAYASDLNFLPTSLQPHGESMFLPHMQVVSVDHTMWFHAPFRLDEWLLYHVESPWAGSGRGLVRGHFYRQDGTLVATTMQEGLIRDKRQSRKS